MTKIIGIGGGQTRVYEDEEVLTMTREVNKEKLLDRIDEDKKMLISLTTSLNTKVLSKFFSDPFVKDVLDCCVKLFF